MLIGVPKKIKVHVTVLRDPGLDGKLTVDPEGGR